MAANYVFDVDGTLTPSRGKMDDEFAEWFENFATHHSVYLVTGSDKKKTLEQIPSQIYNKCKTVYQCSGNDVWVGGVNVRSGILVLPHDLIETMNQILSDSTFEHKTGTHIDIRPGLVNFSIIGRQSTAEQREQYVQWDQKYNERDLIAWNLSQLYPQFNFQIAGQTGIDITVKGSDKSQILKDFNDLDIVYFFGDKCRLGGNDYEIATAVNNRNNGSKAFEVSDWTDTWDLISSAG